MKALFILSTLFLMTCVSKVYSQNSTGKKMTVSQMRATKTFGDVMPKLPMGWKVDSFSVCSVCKRCDFGCQVNAGETFDKQTLLRVQHAKEGDTFMFGDPVYADSFGTKIVTERFITLFAIRADKPKN